MGEYLCGGVAGLIIGAAVALWTLPKSGRRLWQSAADAAQDAGRAVRAGVESAVPTDPVAESIAQGKAAARRRIDELGLNR